MTEFTWVEPGEVTVLPEVWAVEMLRDLWWVVDAQGRLCFAALDKGRPYAYPQANAHKTIAERSHRHIPEAVGITQVPVVYLPHNCMDYRD